MAIEFIGFTVSHRITGAIPLADDRLTDMLNSVARIVVRGGAVEEIDSGRIDRYDATVPCGDFLAVVGSGRRGLESRRRRTRVRRVRIGLGRYVVEGDLHVLPSAHEASLRGEPDALLVGRDLLVPLTRASISYERGGRSETEAWETLLVNRARATWIEAPDSPPEEPPSILQEEPVDETATRPRYAKDFTGAPAG